MIVLKYTIMSTRAYLLKDTIVKHENDELTITKILNDTPTFNVTRRPEIFELFRRYGQDNTNGDCIGEISIGRDAWDEILKWHEKSDEIFKISDDFGGGDSVTYECM